ncbi:hypothetical protein BJY00DRAFT_312049 [Aspergillus carlsbadensis]|nr:hypothetical protein BJY00DRAFT_312049 [Aspergillus carlsbadensis]
MHFTLAAVAAFAASCAALTMSTPQQAMNLRVDSLVAMDPSEDTPSTYHLYLTNYNDEFPNPCVHLGEVAGASRSFTIRANSVPEPISAGSGYTVRASRSGSLNSDTCSVGMLSETQRFDITEDYTPPTTSPRFTGPRRRSSLM